MTAGYQRRSDRVEVDRVLVSCGVDLPSIASVEELTEGTFNTVHLIHLRDGSGLVLKISPTSGTPLMTYESGLTHAEAVFYRAAAPLPSVPTPEVVHADFTRSVVDGDVLLYQERPGHSWHSRRDRIEPTDRARLRCDLGRMVAALHRVTGDGFGYPRAHVALARDWPEAVDGMFGALFADAERFAAPLPLPVADLAELVRANRDVLADVHTPKLVHFDLWNGNILVDFGHGRPEIGGLIDGERAFWGDPVADFVSLALLSDIEKDTDFLTGYREAGGTVTFDDQTRRRLSLYRCYLYLIMLVESVPRGYPERERAALHRMVGPPMRTELDVLAGSGR